MHVVISLLLQSRKFCWYLLLNCSMLLHHVIMTSYCCQRYAESLVTTLCSSRTVRQCTSTPRRARPTVELQRLETPNFLATNLRPPNSTDLWPVDYKIWAVMQHCVNHRQIHSVDELKRQLIDVWRSLEQPIFDETTEKWWGRHQACVHAKGWHFKYSLWTDNVDFVHICYIQCDLFDFYIFLITKSC